MKTLKELRALKRVKVKRVFINLDGTQQEPIFGEIEFRSKDYIFRAGQCESYGYVMAKHLRDFGLEIEASKGVIQYYF